MRLRGILSVACVVVSMPALYAGKLVVTNNFHTVIAGQLYRSALPSADELAEWRDRYGIRTVINLLGAQPGSAWYEAEKAVAVREGITLIDYRLSSSEEVRPDQVEALISLLWKAERPILVHCYRGADRTSLVSALYLAAVAKKSESFSEYQLTPVFGHLSIPFLPAYAMDRSFEAAEPRFGFPGS